MPNNKPRSKAAQPKMNNKTVPTKEKNVVKKKKKIATATVFTDQTGLIAVDNNRIARNVRLNNPRLLSKEGLSFLKLAFAPPDFTSEAMTSAGVPDGSSGKRLLYSHKLVSTFTPLGGNDHYFLMLPTAGFAYWYTTVTAGTPILANTIFGGFPFGDYHSFFPVLTTDQTVNITKTRLVSNHFEIINSANEFAWNGTITAFKLPVSVKQDTILAVAGQPVEMGIGGLEGTNAVSTSMYAGPLKFGVYVGAYALKFPLDVVPVMTNLGYLPSNNASGDFGVITAFGTSNNIPAFQNDFESVCVKITGVANGSNSLIIRVWQTVEYYPTETSLLANISKIGDQKDQQAMDLYNSIVKQMPLAVPAGQNEDYWKRVSSVIAGNV